MSNINGRLVEILAQYQSTVADIERRLPTAHEEDVGRILRPADKQRVFQPPTTK